MHYRAYTTRDNMVRWDIAVAVLGLCAVCTGLAHCGVNDLPGNVFHDKRIDRVWTYSTVCPAGIQQCVRMCLLDGHCRSLTFEGNQLACHLNNRTVDPSSLITENGYVFINNIRRTHNQRLLGDCAQKKCRIQERCVLLTSGPTCIKIEKPHPIQESTRTHWSRGK